MNAPRQGLFASLLILSFALHSILIVVATNYYLKDNRAIQGELLTRQLVNDTLNELDPPNTIALALVANRYATDPSIASLRILTATNQELATAGANKTRPGEVFIRDAAINEQTVGRVEVTLIVPSLGEHLRNQWLPLLLCLILHGLLWLGYRTVARPTRSEFLAKMKREAHLKHEIQRLADALEQEKHQASLAIAKAQQLYQKPKADLHVQDPLKHTQISEHLYLSVQFYDPKQLLGTVNQSVAQTYFNISQLLLNKTMELCQKHYGLSSNDMEVIQPFFDDGAILRVKKDAPAAISTIIQVAVVFQLLSEAMYKRYRDEKRFALQTRCAIAEDLPSMQLSAQKAAVRLGQYLHAKETAIYLSKSAFKDVRHHYDFITLPNPSNALMREALLLQSLNKDCAELANEMRTEILLGRKPQLNTEQSLKNTGLENTDLQQN